MFKRSASTGKTLVIDVKPDEAFTLSARNIAGVRLVPSGRVTARDVMDTAHVDRDARGAREAAGDAGIAASQLAAGTA